MLSEEGSDYVILLFVFGWIYFLGVFGVQGGTEGLLMVWKCDSLFFWIFLFKLLMSSAKSFMHTGHQYS